MADSYIPQIKHIEPYLKIAQQEAKKSPCVRRQYGAVVVNPDYSTPYHVTGFNQRVSKCCEGICARNRINLRNGERVEVGAEVHAETAALLAYGFVLHSGTYLVLAGYNGERELRGTEVWPCHTCANNIKYVGIRWVYMKNAKDLLEPISIADILEYREAEWVPDV